MSVLRILSSELRGYGVDHNAKRNHRDKENPPKRTHHDEANFALREKRRDDVVADNCRKEKILKLELGRKIIK